MIHLTVIFPLHAKEVQLFISKEFDVKHMIAKFQSDILNDPRIVIIDCMGRELVPIRTKVDQFLLSLWIYNKNKKESNTSRFKVIVFSEIEARSQVFPITKFKTKSIQPPNHQRRAVLLHEFMRIRPEVHIKDHYTNLHSEHQLAEFTNKVKELIHYYFSIITVLNDVDHKNGLIQDKIHQISLLQDAMTFFLMNLQEFGSSISKYIYLCNPTSNDLTEAEIIYAKFQRLLWNTNTFISKIKIIKMFQQQCKRNQAAIHPITKLQVKYRQVIDKLLNLYHKESKFEFKVYMNGILKFQKQYKQQMKAEYYFFKSIEIIYHHRVDMLKEELDLFAQPLNEELCILVRFWQSLMKSLESKPNLWALLSWQNKKSVVEQRISQERLKRHYYRTSMRFMNDFIQGWDKRQAARKSYFDDFISDHKEQYPRNPLLQKSRPKFTFEDYHPKISEVKAIAQDTPQLILKSNYEIAKLLQNLSFAARRNGCFREPEEYQDNYNIVPFARIPGGFIPKEYGHNKQNEQQ